MKSGFTLIELILYVAIVGIVLMALIPMAWNVVEGGAKSGVQQEVYSTARYITERINYEIRNSTNITVTPPNSISLTKTLVADNPTIITFTSPDITIKRGAGATTIINSGKTIVSSLVFTDYSGANTKHVRYVLTVSDNYPAGRQEFEQTVTVESSAEARGR